jgi:hypothetical protein
MGSHAAAPPPLRPRRDAHRGVDPAAPVPESLGFDGLLAHAYRAAFFLHGDRATALDITARALARLQVAALSQDRRLRYEPRRSNRTRNRISYRESHLLQQLVFAESEPHERRRERGGRAALTDSLAAVYFVKHLVQITSRRNSFYTTLGMARVLHDYGTPEAQALYEVVVQDPDRVKEDDYWRAAKKRLMNELKSRFGERLRLRRAARGEERFETVEDPQRLAGHVAEALAVFTPWDTPCPIPPRFDPREEILPALVSPDPGDEGDVELRRVHAVLHPSCWDRLAAAVGLEAPEHKLCVPDLGAEPGPGPGSRRPDATAAEAAIPPRDREALVESMRTDALRRRRIVPRVLRVKVDGDVRSIWRLDEGLHVVLRVETEASSLDVVAEDGLPLFACLLPADPEESRPVDLRWSVVAEGGQEVALRAHFARQAWHLELTYAETRLWRRARRRLGLAVRRVSWAAATPALAGALSALVAVLTWRGLATWPPSETPASPSPIVSPGVPGDLRPPAPPTADARGGESVPPPAPGAVLPRLRGSEATAVESVRSLAAVRTLWLDVHGHEPSAAEMRSALASVFASGGRFAVAGDAGDADAALKVTVGPTRRPGGVAVSARCVARDGRVLWPAERDASEHGSIEEIARRIERRLRESAAGAHSGSPSSEKPAQ